MHDAPMLAIGQTDDALTHAMRRVKAEFLEMPGMTLTLAQTARLWAYDLAFCKAVLSALDDARFLVRTRRSAYARAE